MPQNRQLLLGALGFFLLAYLAFWAVSLLVTAEDATFEKPSDPEMLLGGLQVQLLDPDGAPPEDCVVTLWKREAGKLRTGTGLTGRCPGGELGWSGLEPGDYKIEATVPGAERFARNLQLLPGQVLDLDIVQLGPGGILEVHVVGPDGRGLPGAQVWLGNWLASANADGVYRFVGAQSGNLMVRAQFEQIVGMVRHELARGEVAEVEIKLQDLVVPGVLGVSIEAEPEGIRITEVAANGPAADLLEVGDRIIAADGLPTLALTRKIAESRLDGPPGQKVALTLLRGTSKLDVEVVRADLIDVQAAYMRAAATMPPKVASEALTPEENTAP